MPEYLKKGDEIDVTKFGLGTFIVKFEMPTNFINDINELYGGAKDLPKHNQNLAGKIEDELKVSDILTDDMKNCLLASLKSRSTCFFVNRRGLRSRAGVLLMLF